MIAISCKAALVDETLEHLRAAGREGKEGVVLWLSPRPLGLAPVITQAYVPEHEADVDYFRIPPSGMKALMAHLLAQKLVLAAQVHSHPGKAFHSRADDKWAIVRHEGALSIVVPNFGGNIDAANFLDAVATFRLSKDDQWQELEPHDLPRMLRLT